MIFWAEILLAWSVLSVDFVVKNARKVVPFLKHKIECTGFLTIFGKKCTEKLFQKWYIVPFLYRF